MNAQADLHLCCLHMAKTGFLMTCLRLSPSRIEGQVHLKAILQDSEVVTCDVTNTVDRHFIFKLEK